MISDRIGSYFLLVQGFRNARMIDSERVLRDLRESFQGVDLQLLRTDRVAGKEHIIFAARNAAESFRSKGRRAKHLSMELLLFASTQHQIIEAIKLLGVPASSTELALVGLTETKPDYNLLCSSAARFVDGLPDDTVLEIGNRSKVQALKRAYRISDQELHSSRMPGEAENSVLQRLVIERSALLVLEN